MKTMFGAVCQFIRKQELEEPSDSQLLEAYISHQTASAFATLVQRHGPMVWNVCCRLLPTPQDAEDAYQATFLVLVRKAASVWPREQLGSWLHGVAWLTARHARKLTMRRWVREKPLDKFPDEAVTADNRPELHALLDQELQALPDKYRILLVLCDLEGRTRREAAAQLGCPEGTVAGRLARARAYLARRLSRHGLPLSIPALTVFLSTEVTAADKSPIVTIQNLHHSTAVFALTESVLQTLKLGQWKTLAVGLGACVFLLVTGLFATTVFAVKPQFQTIANTRQDTPADTPDARLAEIIAKVEANEKRYRNIEATWGRVYRLHGASSTTSTSTKRSKTRNHCVLQNGLMWVSTSGEYETMDSKNGQWARCYGFDGETTRLFTNQKQGTIMLGRVSEPFDVFRPHTLLLEKHTISKLPLSVLLRNGKELQSVSSDQYRNKDHVITLLGEEKIDGLNCLKLNIEVRGGQAKRHLHFRRYLWLCPERNYLPVKFDAYFAPNMEEVMMFGEVTSWLELAPGQWLPRSWNFNAYNRESLLQEGKQVLICTEHHNLETARLNPSYDKKFFQNVQFTVDMTVNEVNAQGEIIKTHSPGTYKPSPIKPMPME